MRLTCPNCGARYEVDDGLIPPEGRDVQCSNCATTWFQPGRRAAQEPEPEAGPETMPEPPTVPEAPAEDTVGPATATDDIPEAVQTDEAAGPTRRTIDDGVRDILRQEAEREARLRRGEPDPVETQSEMPLDQPRNDTRTRHAAEDPELENAQEAFEAPVPDADGHHEGARRDLLPDIEEINSTLRATGDRAATENDASDVDTVDTALRRRQGVRIGFGLTVLVAAVLAWSYINGDRLIGWLPATEPVIERYVGLVDAARVQLDETAQGLLGQDDTAE